MAWGFPHDGIAVLHHRHAAVRFREEIRQVEPAEFAAGVDMLMSKIEFADQPHDFLPTVTDDFDA